MPPTRATHLYGVVPAATAAAGVDGLPGDVEFVPYREIAALLRPAPADPARQLRPYLLGYAELLDRLAEAGPVLPIRFGTTVGGRSDVTEHVLVPGYDAYQRALAGLAGRAQFTLRARYQGDAAVGEVLAERPELARLHRRLHGDGSPPAAGAHAGRVRLGELLAQAVDGKRAADRELLVRLVSAHAVAVAAPPEAALDGDRVADVACLVERSRAGDLEAAVGDLAHRWRQLARLRLLGPMAPYDFAAGLVGEGPVGGRYGAGG